MLRTLFQPRYAALSVLMLVVAGICTAAGVWQVVRLGEKISDNDALRTNAHAAATPIGSVLPVVGPGSEPRKNAVEFRSVTASGVYLSTGQVLVRSRSVNDTNGYLVVTPLRTAEGTTLLVVRGLVANTASGQNPTVPAPPDGTVDLTGRVQRSETRNDQFAALHNGQVESINASQQAARLGGTVYDGFVQLRSGQAGTDGLIAIPEPDLSNPAGGAVEPQHIAYVIQWFLFAGLALAAPFVMARAETRRTPRDELSDAAAGPAPSHEDVVAAKLDDRYGRAGRRFR